MHIYFQQKPHPGNPDPINATGAQAALPIWAELMKAIPHQISHNDFRVPEGIVTRMICNDDGIPMVSQNCAKPKADQIANLEK